MKPARIATLGDVGDLDAKPGSEPWAIAMRLRLQSKLKERADASESLESAQSAFRKYQAWRLLADRRNQPFIDWATFCRTPPPFGLGTTAEAVEAEVTLRRDRKSEAIRQRRRDYPNESQRQTARAVGCDPGLVNKVLNHKLIQHTTNPLDRLRHWWAKADPVAQQQFRQEIKVT